MLILLLIEAWIAYGNKQNHRILFEGDPPLFNQYGIIPINPDQCLNTHLIASIKVTEWLLSERVSKALLDIAVMGISYFSLMRARTRSVYLLNLKNRL